MGRRSARGGISAGTLFMLLLTAAVIAASALFIAQIADADLYERTSILLHQLQEERTGGAQSVATAEPAQVISARSALMPEETSEPQIVAVPTERPAARPQTITLAAAGTVYAPKAVRQGAQQSADHYDFTPVFSGLGNLLGSADLAIATLETTTAGKDKGYGNYNTPVELLDALRACGVDLVSLGTERALDKGYDGLHLTAGELTARGMSYAGVQLEDTTAQEKNLIGIGGMQIAVLGYAYGLSDEGKEKTKPSERGALCLLDTEQMKKDITAARLNGADLVIVLPHWGTKNKQETPETIRQTAYSLAQAGADVILGTHPNVVQGTDRITTTRSDGLTYETVVCYSLGSLLTDARAQENTAGMVASLSATYDPATRRVTLGDLVCVPVYVACQKADSGYVYRVVDTENAQALSQLSAAEQEAAGAAAQHVRSITGQSQREEAGEG